LEALLSFMLRDGARYDLVHGNFWMSGWVAAQLRRRIGIPAVQIFHATGKTKQRHQGSNDSSPAGRIAAELAVVRDVDRLIAQCPSERDELLGDYGADPRKVVLIPSAVNVERFYPLPRDQARRQIGLDSDGFVVVYVGRMLPRKDVRNLVRAFGLLAQRLEAEDRRLSGDSSNLPSPRLLLVGGETPDANPAATPEIGVLQDLAAQLGIADRVQFTGKRQPDELRFYYGAGDVAVTTPWYEPFGLTPLEAMACGRPVIGSAVGGITFTIQDGLTGLLVPPADPAGLALALYQLLAHPELRAEMGNAARQRVEQEFTWAMVARRTAALYQSVLASRRATPEIGRAHRPTPIRREKTT